MHHADQSKHIHLCIHVQQPTYTPPALKEHQKATTCNTDKILAAKEPIGCNLHKKQHLIMRSAA